MGFKSILDPLLLNIHLSDLFYFLEDLDIASYADDTAIYTVKENKEPAVNTLVASSLPLFTLFNNNFMKGNSDKSHILLTLIRLGFLRGVFSGGVSLTPLHIFKRTYLISI